MSKHTPSGADVLEAWVAHASHDQPTALDLVHAYASWKRWLARVQAEAAVKALRDAASTAERVASGARQIEMADRFGGYYSGLRRGAQNEVERLREAADRIARTAGIDNKGEQQ